MWAFWPPPVSDRAWYCCIPLALLTPGLYCLSCLALGVIPLLWGRGSCFFIAAFLMQNDSPLREPFEAFDAVGASVRCHKTSRCRPFHAAFFRIVGVSGQGRCCFERTFLAVQPWAGVFLALCRAHCFRWYFCSPTLGSCRFCGVSSRRGGCEHSTSSLLWCALLREVF